MQNFFLYFKISEIKWMLVGILTWTFMISVRNSSLYTQPIASAFCWLSNISDTPLRSWFRNTLYSFVVGAHAPKIAPAIPKTAEPENDKIHKSTLWLIPLASFDYYHIRRRNIHFYQSFWRKKAMIWIWRKIIKWMIKTLHWFK